MNVTNLREYERQTDCRECGAACRDLVYAVNVGDQRGPGERHGYRGEYLHVAPDRLEDGARFAGEQCGDCGSPAFTIRPNGSGWVAVCSGDADEDIEGCGRTNPVTTLQAHFVVF